MAAGDVDATADRTTTSVTIPKPGHGRPPGRRLRRWARPQWLWLVTGGVALADLASKLWAVHHVAAFPVTGRQTTAWLQLRLLRNSGMSLGLGAHHRVLVAVLATLAAAAVAAWLRSADAPVQKAGLAVVLGGALGNLVERLSRGSGDRLDDRVVVPRHVQPCR